MRRPEDIGPDGGYQGGIVELIGEKLATRSFGLDVFEIGSFRKKEKKRVFEIEQEQR